MKQAKSHKKQTFLLYLKAYLPSILWGGLIFIMSDQEQLPGFSISLLDFLFKKLAHMFVYAVFYYLLFHAYLSTQQTQQLTKKYYLTPLLIALIYAISDEVHQSFVAGRYANTRDIAYDFLGMMSILLYQQKML